MASPVYLLMLGRQIERLKNPYRLTPAEQLKLDEFLLPDELLEVERRREYIYDQHRLEALPQIEVILDQQRLIGRDTRALEDVVNLAFWRLPFHSERMGRAKAKASDRPQSKNPNAYYDDGSHLLDFHTGMYESLLTGTEHYWARLPDEEKRWWQPPVLPIKSFADVPQPVESWENAIWPDRPNARRQAYIEVLTEKLDRLNRDAS